MAVPLDEYLRCLGPYFTWHTDGAIVTIRCRRCGRTWTLPASNRHVGNILFLLNHGRGHAAAAHRRGER